MPAEELTSINIILDESGSMEPLTDDTIGGFNGFLRKQRELPGRATVSLTKFNSGAKVIYTNVPLEQAGDLSRETYEPGAGTALLDAIGQAVNALKSALRETPEEERPAKVIFLIMTDGQENSSREFGKRTIAEMIRRRREKDGWEFVFMGANVDAFAEAQALGIHRGNTIHYASSAEGTRSAFQRMSDAMSSYRSGTDSRSSSYFEKEKEDSEDPSKKRPH